MILSRLCRDLLRTPQTKEHGEQRRDTLVSAKTPQGQPQSCTQSRTGAMFKFGK